MPNTYKLVLLDLDGTTVASNGAALPSQRVINAVKLAQEKAAVALATGRALHLAQPVIDALSLKGLSVFSGGAEIIDLGSGKTVHREVLSVDNLRELTKLALPFGFKVYIEEAQYLSQLTSADDIKGEASKLLIQAVETRSSIALLEELSVVAGAAAHPATSWHDGDVVDIHVTHEHGTKRYGVEKLIALLGLSEGEVLAIGDGHNDIPLLEAAGTKVAMGNAPAEVKAVADYVAPSLEEDGVADAIERYILKPSGS